MEEELKPLQPWSLPIRIAVLVLLMLYLLIVVLAPLTNPSGALQLTTPIAEAASPVHEALYLDHGYRFFAPNPGPSHICLLYTSPSPRDRTRSRMPSSA